eukprot:1354238-Alexandrium_andersonii.AAC.1
MEPRRCQVLGQPGPWPRPLGPRAAGSPPPGPGGHPGPAGAPDALAHPWGAGRKAAGRRGPSGPAGRPLGALGAPCRRGCPRAG